MHSRRLRTQHSRCDRRQSPVAASTPLGDKRESQKQNRQVGELHSGAIDASLPKTRHPRRMLPMRLRLRRSQRRRRRRFVSIHSSQINAPQSSAQPRSKSKSKSNQPRASKDAPVSRRPEIAHRVRRACLRSSAPVTSVVALSTDGDARTHGCARECRPRSLRNPSSGRRVEKVNDVLEGGQRTNHDQGQQHGNMCRARGEGRARMVWERNKCVFQRKHVLYRSFCVCVVVFCFACAN